MSSASHWQNVYGRTAPDRVGWYRHHLDTSLRMILSLRLSPTRRLLDVGGGASTLVDDLLGEGFSSITVLDLAPAALDIARQRLGPTASSVTWRAADITAVVLPADSIDLWHDRAVFHFLTEAADRQRYLRRLRQALVDGGFVVMGTFSPEAPPKCSGLPVCRYDSAALRATLGAEFELVDHAIEEHTTPGGTQQPYTFCLLKYDSRLHSSPACSPVPAPSAPAPTSTRRRGSTRRSLIWLSARRTPYPDARRRTCCARPAWKRPRSSSLILNHRLRRLGGLVLAP